MTTVQWPFIKTHLSWAKHLSWTESGLSCKTISADLAKNLPWLKPGQIVQSWTNQHQGEEYKFLAQILFFIE